ncbi:MAG: hypothetical protein MJ248_04740 [Bacilli bacterium]|nr:hypothetical protein [Bacilli bacterium]
MKFRKIYLLLAIIPLAYGGVSLSVRAAGDTPNGWVKPNLSNTYKYNSYLDIEECSYFKGGTAYASDHILTYPNGSVTNDDRVLLNVPGKYSLIYTSNVNNSIYSQEYSFDVGFSVVSYNNPTKTSFQYGNLNSLNVGDSSIRTNNAEGLYVRLAANDVLTFNEYIDLSNITATDELIKMFAMPDVYHEEEMNAIQFKLVDSVDPTNYMTILSTRYQDYGYTYSLASGKDQTLTGWERNASKSIKHINDGWGTPTSHTFGGTAITNFTTKDYHRVNVDERCLTFTYDPIENCLYSLTKKLATPVSSGDLTDFAKVCDFNDPNDFTTLWNGFKSNKVKLEVSSIGTSKETSNLCFAKVFGLDLSSATINKTSGPNITINHSGSTPQGEVNKTYKIPTATANDEYFGECKVSSSVYYRYDSDVYRRQLSIKDGSFVPTKPGLYAIVYRSSDYLGNVSEKILQVIVSETLEPISFDVPNISSGFVGQEIYIPSLDGVDGGSGLYTIKVTAKLDNEVIEIEDNKFIPTKAGNWTIEYSVSDYIGNVVTKSTNVNVGVKDGYLAEKLPVMFPGFVLNNTYVIPELTLSKYDANGNKTSIKSKVRIKDKVYTSGDSFVPVSDDAEGFITLEYFEGSEVFKTYNVPFLSNVSKSVDAEGLVTNDFAADRYFITNGTRTWLESGVQVVSNVEKTTTTFANFVSTYDFSLNIGTFTNFANDNSITISLTNYKNEDEVASIQIIKKNYGYDIVGFDGSLVQITSENDFAIGFDGTQFVINNSFKFKCDITEPIDAATLKIESDKTTGYVIKSIMGSQVTNRLSSLQDKQGPGIAFTDVFGGTKEINEIYKICKVNVFDLFSPNVDKSLTVKDPDGNYATTIDGEVLNNVDPSKDRYIKLDKFGFYEFRYETAETAEYKKKYNSYSKTYMVEVLDSVAPTITFKSDFKTSANLNSLVVLPNYEVNDNYSAEEKISVRIGVTNPDGVVTYLKGNSFYVNYVGTYKISYFVFDEAGNSTIVSKYMEVK